MRTPVSATDPSTKSASPTSRTIATNSQVGQQAPVNMYDIAKTRDRKRSTPYNASAFYCGTHFDHRYQQYVNQSIEDIEVALML
jgi:hypothetical protein